MNFPSLEKIVVGTQFIGFELFTVNGADRTAVVKVENRNEELFIVQEYKTDKIVFTEEINKKLPFFLIFNTAQTIQKEVDSIDSFDLKIVNRAFPNLKIDEFYYEIWKLESKSIVAICRKNYINETIKKYAALGVSISGISLGICGIASIKKYVIQETLNTNGQTIQFAENEPIFAPREVNDNYRSYTINGLEVKNSSLLCFSVILRKISNGKQTTGNTIAYNDILWNNFYQRSFFRKVLNAAVFSLILILALNFFIFNHYFEKSNEISVEITANKDLIEKIRTTKNSLKSKEYRLKTTTSALNSKSSFIVNELVKNIPPSVLLNELIYHPLDKRIKPDEQIIVQNEVVMISGETIQSANFTKWIEGLNTIKWVKKITIINFGKNETNKFIFTLKINLDANAIK